MFPKFLREKVHKLRMAVRARANRKSADVKDVDMEYSKRYKAEHPIDPVDKVIRESGGQDITAI